MNFIKYLYNKIKSSYDDYWTEYERQMESLTIGERAALNYYLFDINNFNR